MENEKPTYFKSARTKLKLLYSVASAAISLRYEFISLSAAVKKFLARKPSKIQKEEITVFAIPATQESMIQ